LTPVERRTAQFGGGHNLSLGHCSLAYHLEILSFAEECALAREAGDVERVS